MKWNVCEYYISNTGELVVNVGGVRFFKKKLHPFHRRFLEFF